MNDSLPKEYKDIDWLEQNLSKLDEEEWMTRGRNRALGLFHSMAERVPAYKDFLRKNNINPATIKTIEDFKNIPTIDKDNYLRAYPLEELCWDGEFSSKRWTISTTSGSTGDPFYFPRELDQNWQYAILAELYLRTNFQIDKKKTLYIVGFPMGAWIGGLFTYQALELVAENGNYPLSIITPGIHKEEIIKAVKKFGDKFDQIIIGSYAPFLKDVLDDGIRMGVNWEKYNLRFVFSAEGFTENFRDYILRIAGLEETALTSTLNHYGTVDLGTMSYETPLAILIRRMAVQDKSLYNKIFGDTIKLPTLTQYFPELFYFEEMSGKLICSAYSGLPLVRYDLKDNGGIITFEKMLNIFKEHDMDLTSEAEKAGISNTVWKLPFVYVYERNDFSVSFYAFNIYPETIRRVLQKKELETFVTGKFTMIVTFDQNQNQVLEINIEMKSGVIKDEQLEKNLQNDIKLQLIEESSEYRETYREKKDKVAPHIILWSYESPIHFKPGIKQKWVKKI